MTTTSYERLRNETKNTLNHGKESKPKAKKTYVADATKLKLKRCIFMRKTGIAIQPFLFWLAASPDVFVADNN